MANISSKWIWGLLTLAVTIPGAYLWFVNAESNGIAQAPAPAAQSSASQQTQPSASSPSLTPAAATASASSAERGQMPLPLKIQAMNAKDYRVLFERLFRAPENGGGYYAMDLLSKCQRFRESAIKFPMAATSEQSEAQQIIKDRCASFTADEITSERMLAVSRNPSIQADIYRKISDEWSDAGKTNLQKQEILRKVFSLEDPLLLEYYSVGIFYQKSNGVQFNGELYSSPNVREIFSVAWIASACEATLTLCSPNSDNYLLQACAEQKRCFATRQELFADDIERRFGKEGKDLYLKVQPSVQAQMQARNLEAFLGNF